MHTETLLLMPTNKFALLSIYPRYANKILSGEKRLEFRKSWASSDVSSFVIYATTPVQKIVGIARVKQVHKGSATALWQLAQQIGGGVSRRVLYDYFRGKPEGFAIEIESVLPCSTPLDPELYLPNFTPPQSFVYLERAIYKRIETAVTKQPSKGRMIFIAGVHGVGKTTLCSSIQANENLVHKSASQLIREAKASAIASNSKVVADIAGNQKLLIDAVRQITLSGKTLLLDGHFALFNKNRKAEALPTKVFSDLGIDAVLMVHDSPSSILARLRERDGSDITISELRSLQSTESRRAKTVSDELGLPFFRVKAFDESAFAKAITALQP